MLFNPKVCEAKFSPQNAFNLNLPLWRGSGKAQIPIGFSKQEAENLKKLGVKLVSLGKRILRTETAAIAVMASIIYHYRDFRD